MLGVVPLTPESAPLLQVNLSNKVRVPQILSLVPEPSRQGRRLRSAPRIIVGQSVALRSIQNALDPVLYRRLLVEFLEVLDMINGGLQRVLQVLKS